MGAGQQSASSRDTIVGIVGLLVLNDYSQSHVEENTSKSVESVATPEVPK